MKKIIFISLAILLLCPFMTTAGGLENKGVTYFEFKGLADNVVKKF